jgi:hypothetical protein
MIYKPNLLANPTIITNLKVPREMNFDTTPDLNPITYCRAKKSQKLNSYNIRGQKESKEKSEEGKPPDQTKDTLSFSTRKFC